MSNIGQPERAKRRNVSSLVKLLVAIVKTSREGTHAASFSIGDFLCKSNDSL